MTPANTGVPGPNVNSPSLTVLPLDSTSASLATVGGKGWSLARLAAAGLPVPDGFLLSTSAYQALVEANGLQEAIWQLVAGATAAETASLERASTSIRSLFETATLPREIAASIEQAYAALGDDQRPAVAVRSSATAEDLPDHSAAGLQDTYLNVRGEERLLAAIHACWASLWTARAIGYRERMRIDQRTVAMGVVVQRMVPAEVSGILFTANPASGDRTELVINASFGLGEAVVGGHVTPDTYVLDRTSLETKQTVVGSKLEAIVPAGAQGTTTERVPDVKRNSASLPPETQRQLATLSRKVETIFDGVPQDIEWAVVDGVCWLLQSRPITNLPSPPPSDASWEPPTEGGRFIRRQVVENMPDPLSPLFAELYLQEGLERSMDKLMEDFGMPLAIEDFMERPMFVTINGYAYCRASYHSTWRMLRLMPKLLYWYATAFRKLLRTVIPHWRDEGLPAYLKTIQQWKAVDPATASDEQLLSGMRQLTVADATYWFDVAMVLGAAKISDGMLNWFVTSRFVRGDLTSGALLRGFPSQALKAQEDLEAIANKIRTSDGRLRELVCGTPTADLQDALSRDPAGHAVRDELLQYFEQYGHQIYTLDFAEPTQLEDPLPVLLTLQRLVERGECDTRTRQAEMARDSQMRVQQVLESLGPLRRWLFRKLLGWAQTYCPYREDALFSVGAAWPTLRCMARELGERLVQAGTLTLWDDVFYLTRSELSEACAARGESRAAADLTQTVGRRRELREARKKLHPPGMVPENSTFRFGPFDLSMFETQKRNTADANTLDGFAVSPGKVTAPASVILSPRDFDQMKPDTILVCPTTTPAWTPLFAQAAGLATDIGGILAHGSIVAREYGIPAVMGTGNLTQRIVSGQRITVDGNRGTVTILD